MLKMIRHLRHRRALQAGITVTLIAVLAGLPFLHTVQSMLVGWDLGVLAYLAAFLLVVQRSTVEGLQKVAASFDEGRWGVLIVTVGAAIASLAAIVAELARVHGTPHANWGEALAGSTVILSWIFIHTVFTTHYAHEFWSDGSGLNFPGNTKPDYGEFLYFAFCIAVASQVSDVSTESAGMRQLVLAHSIVAYLFNTAIIALGVNIAASLAS